MDQLQNNFFKFNYNISKKDIEKKVQNITANEFQKLEHEMKSYMQEILANLLGCHNFFDAATYKNPVYYNYILNNQSIGKKKLTEFLAMIIELEKKGYYLDQITLEKNANDELLKKINGRKDKDKFYYPSYLEFDNLNDFLKQVIKIFENNALVKEDNPGLETYLNKRIPDPNTFDYQHNYYESIDSTKYLGENNQELKRKHPNNGIEVNAPIWIRNFQNRFSLINPITEKTLWKEEIQKIKQAGQRKKQESEKSKDKITPSENEVMEKLKNLNNSVESLLKSQNITISQKELELYSKELMLEMQAKKSKEQKKKRTFKYIAYLSTLAAAIGASFYIGTKQAKRNSDNHQIKISIETMENQGFNFSEEQTKKKSKNVTLPNSQSEAQTEESILEEYSKPTFQKIGNVIQVEGTVPYYTNTTTTKKLGTRYVNGFITGYFATIPSSNSSENILIQSCRSQEEIDEFLNNYTGNLEDITWKAAVCNSEDISIDEYIASGKSIPYTLTTFFIDYEPEKEKTRTKGGK